MKWSCVLLFFIFILSISCKKDKAKQIVNVPSTGICGSASVDFATVIQPLIIANCATSSCHDALGNSAGITLETHAQISAKSDRVLGAIKQMPGFSMMPKFQNKLADSSIQQVECWINKGMPQ